MQKRLFSLRYKEKTKGGKLCQSLPHIQQFAQFQIAKSAQHLEDNLKFCGSAYGIKLLRTLDRLVGKISNKNKDALNLKVNTQKLQEKVHIKILEECDDPTLVGKYDFIQVTRFFDEFYYDSEKPKSVKEIYDEILRRGYMFTEKQIEEMNQNFLKIQNFQKLKFAPRLKNDILQKYKDTDRNDIIADKLGLKNKPKPIVHYNNDLDRITINHEGIRYVIQQVDNYGYTDIPKIIYNFSKERFNLVLLSLPQNEKNSILTSYDQITSYLQKYLDQQNKYRASDTEKLVFEKVNGLKTVNFSLSAMYNVWLKGDPEACLPVGLLLPSNDHSIKITGHQLELFKKKDYDFFKVLQDQLLLDRLDWFGQIAQSSACPKCNDEKLEFGPDMSYPFIRHLSNREFNKNALVTQMCNNIKHMSKLFKKEGENLSVIIFIDEAYSDVIQIAKGIVEQKEDPKQQNDIAIDDYLKLSFLFDGINENKIVEDHKDQVNELWKLIKNQEIFDQIDPHKYDYKCYPINIAKYNP